MERWAYSRGLHVGLMCAIALIHVAQTPSVLMQPPLFAEDGGLFFEHFYNRLPSEAWLIYYQSYVSVTSNLLAWIASHVPTRQVPHAYWLIAQGVSSWALSVFYLPRFRTMVGSDGLRLTACLVLAALPLGNSFLFATITWCFWPMMVAATLLSLVPATVQRPRARAGELAFLTINACSSPVSSLLLPIYMWRVWRDRGWEQKLAFILLGLFTIAYMVVMRFQLLPTSVVAFADVEGQLLRGDYSFVDAAVLTVPVILDRVVFEALFTARMRVALIYRDLHAVTVVIGFTVALVGGWLALKIPVIRQHARNNRPLLLGAAYIVLALTFIALWFRFGREAGLGYLSSGHQRYFWVQQYLIGIVAVTLLSPQIATLGRAMQRGLLGAVLVVVIVSNVLDAFEFDFRTARPAEQHEFLDQVGSCEEAPSSKGCELPMIFTQELSEIDAHTIEIRRLHGQ